MKCCMQHFGEIPRHERERLTEMRIFNREPAMIKFPKERKSYFSDPMPQVEKSTSTQETMSPTTLKSESAPQSSQAPAQSTGKGKLIAGGAIAAVLAYLTLGK